MDPIAAAFRLAPGWHDNLEKIGLIQQKDFLRNERNRPQNNDCETNKFKKKTTANEFYRGFDEFKAKFRNHVETVVDVVTSMAMIAVAIVVNVMLRVEQRQSDHQLV